MHVSIPLFSLFIFFFSFCCRNDADAAKVYRCFVGYLVLLSVALLIAICFAVAMYVLADAFPDLIASNYTEAEVSCGVNLMRAHHNGSLKLIVVGIVLGDLVVANNQPVVSWR